MGFSIMFLRKFKTDSYLNIFVFKYTCKLPLAQYSVSMIKNGGSIHAPMNVLTLLWRISLICKTMYKMYACKHTYCQECILTHNMMWIIVNTPKMIWIEMQLLFCLRLTILTFWTISKENSKQPKLSRCGAMLKTANTFKTL